MNPPIAPFALPLAGVLATISGELALTSVLANLVQASLDATPELIDVTVDAIFDLVFDISVSQLFDIEDTIDSIDIFGPGSFGGDTGGTFPGTGPFLQRDPFVIDLDGDGIELISAANAGVFFDFDENGFAEQTGWLAADDGFLFLDENGDGVASGISELFGNLEVDGFTELATLDTNGDGIISVADDDIDELKIWRDLNQDGVSTADEVFTIDALGISEIGLEQDPDGYFSEGNEVAYTGTVSFADGTINDTGAVFFGTNTTFTAWVAPDGFVVSDAAVNLPDVKGYGNLPDLSAAMTLDDGLRLQVENLVLAAPQMSFPQMQAAFEAILFEWAGVAAVADGAYGAHADAQEMAFLETFYGFGLADADGTIAERASATFEENFDDIANGLFLRFAAGIAEASILLGMDIGVIEASPFSTFLFLGYQIETDSFSGSPTAMASFVATHASTLGEDEARAFLETILTPLKSGRFDISADNLQEIVDQLDGRVSVSVADYAATLIQAGGDVVLGTDGDDVLDTGVPRFAVRSDQEVLIGGAGDDTLDGGLGNDTYLYRRGDGNDIIEDSFNSSSGGPTFDTLVLNNIDPAQVTVSLVGGELVLVIEESTPGAGDGGTITLIGNANDSFGRGIEEVTFDDGTVWGRDQLRELYMQQEATDGDDTITAFNSNDTIAGGLGDDHLIGGEGNDTYVYNNGDGNDVIDDTYLSSNGGPTFDTVQLVGIDPARVTMGRDEDAMILVIAESAPGAADDGTVTLLYGANDYFGRGVDQVTFDDGTVWNRDDLRTLYFDQQATDGDDTITGFVSDDVITGGLGDDLLIGGVGNDIYVYNNGDGHDVIDEANTNTTGVPDYLDVLRLNGITQDRISFDRDDADSFILNIAESAPGAGDAGSVSLLYDLEEFHWRGVEFVSFSTDDIWTRSELRVLYLEQEATDGDDTINGFYANDTIAGGRGDDLLTGGYGDDVYVYTNGDGHDVIDDTYLSSNGGPTFDTVQLVGIDTSRVSVARDNSTLILVIAESAPGAVDSGTVALLNSADDYFGRGIEQVEFDDGTIWSRNDLRAFTFAGTDGDDTINGTNATDTLAGGLGDDLLIGGQGNDIYIYNNGDGDDVVDDTYVSSNGGPTFDTVQLVGIDQSRVTVSRDSGTLILIIAESAIGAGDSGTVALLNSASDYYGRGIEQIEFDDGTVWSRSDLRLLSLDGTDGDDTITGYSSNDTITGGLGDDLLDGEGGNDIYVYNNGDGDDVVDDTYASSNSGTTFDTVQLVGIDASRVSITLDDEAFILSIAESLTGSGDAGSITLIDSANDDSGRGIEQVEFDDGTVWSRDDLRASSLVGTDGDDIIDGFNSDDTLVGGQGDDILDGGAGDDTLIGGLGDDNLDGGSGDDTLVGGQGDDFLVGGSGSEAYVYYRGDGHDTVSDTAQRGNSGSANDTVELVGISPGEVAVHRDGNAFLLVISETMPGTGDAGSIRLESSANDYGVTGVELVTFDDGTVWSRDDLRVFTLAGTDGDDTITGFNIDDTLIGGLGDDLLIGGSGSDIYVYNRGDGHDVVSDTAWYGSTGSANDRVSLVGISPDGVSVQREGETFVLDIAESAPGANDAGSIRLERSVVDSGVAGVEGVVFDDGTVWTRDDLRALELLGTNGDDVLTDSAGSQIYGGKAGIDTVKFLAARDAFQFQQGVDGSLIVVRGDDQDIVDDSVEFLEFTDGVVDFSSVYATAEIPPDITLTLGTVETDSWGNNYDGKINVDGVISAAFADTGEDLLLTFDGFDIDHGSEVELFLNGNSMGYLDGGVNDGLASYHFFIAAEDQLADNELTFVQQANPVYTWGVTGVLLDTAPVDNFALTLGTVETDSWGNNYDGKINVDGVISAAFADTGEDLLLTFDGFDIDHGSEVELFLNGNSMGYLDGGVNDGLASYHFFIAAEDQLADNELTFVQQANPIYTWGVSDVLIDEFIV